jgi:hypothetical protein
VDLVLVVLLEQAVVEVQAVVVLKEITHLTVVMEEQVHLVKVATVVKVQVDQVEAEVVLLLLVQLLLVVEALE